MHILKTKQIPKHFITANWQAPTNITAFTTTSLHLENLDALGAETEENENEKLTNLYNYNLALHTGDNPQHVKDNRTLLQKIVGDDKTIMWLNQTHSNRVVTNYEINQTVDADSSFSDNVNFTCAILTADCLPVLITNKQGNKIAAVHAGWQGLYSNIITNAISSFNQPTNELLVWLAPAITQANYEVDKTFYNRFLDKNPINARAFIKNRRTAVVQHYLCDLYELARIELQEIGVLEHNIWQTPKTSCTFANTSLYSYRRTKITGRMASVIFMDNLIKTRSQL